MAIAKPVLETDTQITNRLLREVIQNQTILINKLGGLKTIQPQANYFQANVPPLSLSNLQLPGGKNEPFYYYLGVDSTIPFVSLQGGGLSQKSFSWGEIIEVPAGQTVTVKNDSYMIGDIQINSGNNSSVKPERISVPFNLIPYTSGPLSSANALIAPFPADTRRCRRAYVKCHLISALAPGGQGNNIVVLGKAIKHSSPGNDSYLIGIGAPYNYFSSRDYAPSTSVGEFSLGFGLETDKSLPMGLCDQTIFILADHGNNGWNILSNLFMYVMEY